MRSISICRVLVAVFASLLVLSSAKVTQATMKTAKNELKSFANQVKNVAQRQAIMKAGKRAMRALRAQGGCKAVVCFALEGSSEISPATYNVQKLVAGIVGAVVKVDPRAALGAAQYSRLNTAITPVTGSAARFYKALGKSKQRRDSGINFSAGLAYCWFEAKRNSKPKKRVVVMGTGKFNVGFRPSIVMAPIKRDGGRVVSVLTKGGKSAFVSSLGSKKKDIIPLYSTGSIAAALPAIISDICDVKLA